MSILEIFNSFVYHDEYKSCCFQNCVRQVLEYNGIKYAHLLINTNFDYKIILNNSPLGFEIIRYSDRMLHHDYDQYIVFPDIKGLTEHEMIDYEKNTIKENIIPIIGVDIFYLYYCKNYMKSNSFHTAILGGYDASNAILLDIGEKIKFNGGIPMDEYLKARTSKNPKGINFYSGVPINKYLAYLEESFWNLKIDYISLIQEAVFNAIKYYDDIAGSGVNGIKELGSILSNIVKTNKYDQRLFDYLYFNLYEINKYRKLFGLTIYYLETYNFDVVVSKDLLRKIKMIIQSWDNVISLFVKIKYSNEKENTVLLIIHYLEETLLLEKNITNDLQDIYNQITM